MAGSKPEKPTEGRSQHKEEMESDLFPLSDSGQTGEAPSLPP